MLIATMYINVNVTSYNSGRPAQLPNDVTKTHEY